MAIKLLPLRSDFAQRIVSHVYKIPMPSGNTSRDYKYTTATTHPRDHAESAVSPTSRSASAERKTKRNVAAAWRGWIRQMDTYSLSHRERESTGFGVKWEIVAQKGWLTKGSMMNVLNCVGARDCHSVIS